MNLSQLKKVPNWETFVNFNSKTPLKKRQKYIVKMGDFLSQYYIFVIVKYDKNKNIHIRYLNNPFIKEMYWWTGNKENLCGLNSDIYKAKFLGDDINEMEGLRRSDFQENGYDDIINFDENNIYYCTNDYPFLGGTQGNVHTHEYFKNIYLTQIKSLDMIPFSIVDYISNQLNYNKELLNNNYSLQRFRKKYDDIGEFDSDENIEVNKILKSILNAVTYTKCIYDNLELKKLKVSSIDQLKKYISLNLTNFFIKKNARNETEIEQFTSYRSELDHNNLNINVLDWFPIILKIELHIFDATDEDMICKVYGDKYRDKIDENKLNKIFLIKYRGQYESLIFI